MLALLTVTTNQDVVDLDDGVLSLREAIFVANTVPGADTIEFDFGHDGPETIVLTEGELVITDSVTIDGFDASLLTIDASGNDPTPASTLRDSNAANDGDGSRVFNIDDGNNSALKEVEIRGLRITGGDVNGYGGGILARENLVLRESIVEGNVSKLDGGGVFSGPTFSPTANSLTVVDCLILDNASATEGGGLRKVLGNLVVDRTLVKGNEAGAVGGGISAANELVQVLIRDSMIRQNRVTAPFPTSTLGGGGIFLFDATATIANSSVVENEANEGGGISVVRLSGQLQRPVTTIINSTVSDNVARFQVGGIVAQLGAQVNVLYSTIANNSLAAFGGVEHVYSTIVSGNASTGSFGSDGFNLLNPSSVGILAPLAGNGEQVFLDGSRMRMHALLPGSPAIDAGNPADMAGVASVPEFDQRRMPFGRVVDGNAVPGARIDIGAYERQPGEELSFVVDTFDDDDGDNYAPGDRSLREAIALANSVPGVNTITFAPELFANGPGTISLKYGELAITEALVIDGPGAELLTVDAQQQSRVFNITATAGNFTIDGLTAAHGRTTGNNVSGPNPYVYSGGAIRSVTSGTLTFAGVHVVDSGTTGTAAAGGGVFSQGPLVLNGSVVSGNSTAGNNAYGGGVATRSTFSAVDSIVDGNRVFGLDMSGGGIWSQGMVSLTHSVVTNNALMNGSPVFLGGPPTGGGGVFAMTGSVTLTDSNIEGNTTTGTLGGAGIRGPGLVTITRSNVSDNHAAGGGGGVLSGGQVNVVDSTIARNSSVGIGGGIYGVSVLLTNSTVSGNLAGGTQVPVLNARGGGIAANSVVSNFSTISDNHSMGSYAVGGGVAATLSGRGSIIAGNSASTHGDDLFGPAGNLQFSLLGNIEGTPAGNLVEAPVGSPDARGNLIGGPLNGIISAKLGPLSYNGGPVFVDGSRMLTHALLSGSPAIAAGDPAAVAGMGGVPAFDQRGEPHLRVLDDNNQGGARIDMGAYERAERESFTLVVDTLVDELDGDYGPGDLSLREAIEIANTNLGTDTIEFSASLDGGTIRLGLDPSEYPNVSNELYLSPMVLRGPGADLLTIDAQGNSRIFNDNHTTGAITISGLTLTGGKTEEAGFLGHGGAIRTITHDTLTLADMRIIGNHTVGDGARGGAVWANGPLVVLRSEISGNSTAGFLARGGGIAASGEGVTVVESWVHGNYTQGNGAGGGGIHSYGSGEIINSTISGNWTEGDQAGGAGFHGYGATLRGATISGNRSNGERSVGAGIFSFGEVEISYSTITANMAIALAGKGGGLLTDHPAQISHSIIADNLDAAGNPDLYLGAQAGIDFSLIGDGSGSGYVEAPVGTPDANGNLVGGPANGLIDPLLGPLTNNGGPTKTHALLPGSPAIDAGDPAAVAGMDGVPEFDQRGAPWVRVVGGRIDIGAIEAQANPLPGDYNFNGMVDAADYSVWRDTLGSMTDLRADGSSQSMPGVPDGVVDAFDYGWWKANFGNVYEQGAGGNEQGAGSTEQGVFGSGSLQTIAGELRLAGEVDGGDAGHELGDLRSAVMRGLEPHAEQQIRAEQVSVPAGGPARRSSSAKGRAGQVDVRERDRALLAWGAGRGDDGSREMIDSESPHRWEASSDGTSATLAEAFTDLGRQGSWRRILREPL